MAVGMSHQLIGFFGGGIEAYWMINSLSFLKWKVCITAINTAARCIHKMFNGLATATFKNMAKTHQIALHIGIWVFQ